MEYANLDPVVGIVLNFTGSGCCSQMIALRVGEGIVNIVIDSETEVIDCRQLRPGMRVAAFYDKTLPVPMIFPPQYRAVIIAVLGKNEQIALKYFDSDLIAEDRSLQLNQARSTEIETINGQNFFCDIGNRTLLVYYTVTTRSIPPQTTPRKIVVLCSKE
ncbi:hypothetical protein D3Z53_21525 [Lachnospiraceae bacterium]|jgi:hypothetical protein|nr:hypothetical protein [uncultured Schaedlerella sp.]EOS39913.1 hypothetical protein C808_00883 [Lachnospiraceae bacterium M18-1]MCI9154184.1 hypothetical protein [Ruminococcus sp.]NBI60558.1 hypothetical protein [Lachnospiraceae bacterium]